MPTTTETVEQANRDYRLHMARCPECRASYAYGYDEPCDEGYRLFQRIPDAETKEEE